MNTFLSVEGVLATGRGFPGVAFMGSLLGKPLLANFVAPYSKLPTAVFGSCEVANLCAGFGETVDPGALPS